MYLRSGAEMDQSERMIREMVVGVEEKVWVWARYYELHVELRYKASVKLRRKAYL